MLLIGQSSRLALASHFLEELALIETKRIIAQAYIVIDQTYAAGDL
jgi:hypothetical protein